MPKLHTKVQWEYGPGTLLTYERDPSAWYLRVHLPGTEKYTSARLPGCSDESEAQQQAIGVYAKLIQPAVVVKESNNQSIRFQISTAKNAKAHSRLMTECVDEWLDAQLQRVKYNDIVEETYLTRERYLRKILLPYFEHIGLRHTRELSPTTFDAYNLWRSRTSSSKVTRNVELNVYSYFFKDFLVRHRLIAEDLMTMHGFLPFQKIRESDLLSNPAINEEDWTKIIRSIHRWVKHGELHTNHRVGFYRHTCWTFFMTIKNTAIRPAELRRLRWKNIEFEKEIRFSKSKNTEEKRWVCHIHLPAPVTKTRRARDVSTRGNGGNRLHDHLRYVREYCQTHGHRQPSPEDLIFASPDLDYGLHRYKEIGNSWRSIVDDLDLQGNRYSDKRYTIYSLRTSYIEDCLADGVDIWLISRNAGHSINVLTRFYERLDTRKRSKELTDLQYGKRRDRRENVYSFDDLQRQHHT